MVGSFAVTVGLEKAELRKGVTAEKQEAKVMYAPVYLQTWIAMERFTVHNLCARICQPFP